MQLPRVTCVPKHTEKRRKQWRDHRERKLESLTPEEAVLRKEEKRIYDEAYRAKNRKPKAKWRKKYRKRCNTLQNARYRRLHPIARPPKMTAAQRRKVARDYRARNRDMKNAWQRAYYAANAKNFLEQRKEYRLRNYAKFRAYEKKRAAIDRKKPWHRLVGSLYASVNKYLRGKSKSARTMQLVGCTRIELMRYLEMQFTEWMTWENYGRFGWHVDHKTPLAAFDMFDPDQQKLAFHYTNLRPLHWRENLSKNDLLPDGTRARVLKKQRSLNATSEVLSKGE